MLLKSPAKLNLTLDVVGKRQDGYHLIESVMQTVSLCDEIHLMKAKELSIQTDVSFIPDGPGNIAFRAAELFFKTTQKTGGVSIKIKKNIPVGAGLGGGSSNAASVLHGLNIMYDANLTKQQLEKMGLELGTDVPFFFTKGVCLATGLGQELKPINSQIKATVVIIKPNFSVSTKFAYKKLDKIGTQHTPNTDAMITALQSGSVNEVGANLYNAFESVISAAHPQILTIKQLLINAGAQGAQMTGSGSAVFGIFKDEKTAHSCAVCVSKKYRSVFIASFYTNTN
ncbi:MAG: 4-(cytidine 5'-diphospho)-2-C-methyl-D-erythritol kinase [Clostridiaceae bacterium]|nr:4-(cytidine 5'-diphospho)-2-C-methyl-D-erythritol kinase [Clostridiaceae bacterium]